jgi:trk system potassium uptake protein TrkH
VTAPENQVWPQFQSLPVSAKISAVVIMTLGRLEVMIVFAVLNIRYWMSR